jgi:hypothetical protein
MLRLEQTVAFCHHRPITTDLHQNRQADLSGVIRRDRLIVLSSLKKINRTIAYAVNQPVFLGNTP